MLSGLVAGVVSLTALKAGAVDLQDERDVRQRGFDIIYEARDLDLDQSTRDGLTQYRKNIDSTKARIKEAERILDNNLDPLIQKKYWYATSAVLLPCFGLCCSCNGWHHACKHPLSRLPRHVA